ncbi:MAG: hypothetical protein R3288_04435 [Woeseiaceae bacterium]|nr:hypothetical protein [Woeseiaceae bacterium]
MRALTLQEIDFVAGGTGECSADDSGDHGNEFLGGAEPADVGPALIEVYEGLVEAASHVIERVANAL